jgi:hypothetical protein
MVFDEVIYVLGWKYFKRFGNFKSFKTFIMDSKRNGNYVVSWRMMMEIAWHCTWFVALECIVRFFYTHYQDFEIIMCSYLSLSINNNKCCI